MVKDVLLDEVKLEVKKLERKNEKLTIEATHYEDKAKEWKKKALQLEHDIEKLKQHSLPRKVKKGDEENSFKLSSLRRDKTKQKTTAVLSEIPAPNIREDSEVLEESEVAAGTTPSTSKKQKTPTQSGTKKRSLKTPLKTPSKMKQDCAQQ